MTVASLFAELGVDTSPMTGVARDVRSKLQPLQQTFQQVGSSLTKFITVPLTGAAAAATKTGTTIDSNFAKIEGLVGESREALQGMRSDVLGIGTATGKGPEELSEALFFVESAGFRGEEAVSVLEQSAKAAAAGLGETKDVADAVTSAVNAYGIENLSAARATDVLTATVREGKVEADQLASSLGKVIPQASQMGVEFNEVGATLASLTRIGANSRRATTALNAVLTTINKGAPKTEEALREMGTSLGEVRAQIENEGLLPALQTLQQGFDNTSVRMTDVFSNVRALRGVLGLLGSNAEEAENIFNSLSSEVAGSTQTAFEAVQGTIRNQFNRALREAQALLDGVYQTFKGRITSVLQTVRGLLSQVRKAWDGLSETAQGLIVVSAAVAASLGPILLALSGILAIAPAVTAALSAMGAAAPYIAAIGAVAVAVQQNWDSIAAFFTSGPGAEMWDALQTAALATKRALMGVFNDLSRAVGTLLQAFNDAVRGGGGIISMIGTSLSNTFERLAQLAVPIMNQIAGTIGFLANTIARAVSFIVNILTGDFAGAWQDVQDQFGAFETFLLRTLANVTDAILTFIESTLNSIPKVNVEFDGMRSSIREWRRQLREDTDQANSDLSGHRDLLDGVKDSYQTLGEEGKKAGEKVKTAANKAKEAAQEARGAMEELGVAQLTLGTEAPSAPTQNNGEGSQGQEQGTEGAEGGLNAVPDKIARIQTEMSAFRNFTLTAIGQTDQAMDQMVQKIGEGFAQLITTGKLFGKEVSNIGDAFKALGELVTNIIRQMIQQLIAAIAQALIFKALTGGGGGGFFNLAASFLGGGGPSIAGSRAGGGPVSGGRNYIVGEEEPEIFTPDRSGTVTPVSKMQGARSSNAAVVKLGQPQTLPNGDLQFSLEEGSRQESRRGFPDSN